MIGVRASFLPVLTIVATILAFWYAMVPVMNGPWERQQAGRAGEAITFSELLLRTMMQDRPILPAPHQVAVELWDTTIGKSITSKRSLVYHTWVTFSATALGFVIGTLLGVLIAVGIVHSRPLNASLMPSIITSQTIPILAIAPMVIVVMASIGATGLFRKAVIST